MNYDHLTTTALCFYFFHYKTKFQLWLPLLLLLQLSSCCCYYRYYCCYCCYCCSFHCYWYCWCSWCFYCCCRKYYHNYTIPLLLLLQLLLPLLSQQRSTAATKYCHCYFSCHCCYCYVCHCWYCYVCHYWYSYQHCYWNCFSSCYKYTCWITDYKLNRGKDANILPGLSSQDIALSNTISLIYWKEESLNCGTELLPQQVLEGLYYHQNEDNHVKGLIITSYLEKIPSVLNQFL